MIEIPVYDKTGKQVGSYELDEALVGGEVRPTLLKQAYVMFHANRRQGSAHKRGRSDKEGSTRKLYKQKGTGRARRGQLRTNVMRGGGVAFAPKPRDFRQSMPKKMRRLANRNAILAKAVDGEIKLIDSLNIETPKTKDIEAVLTAMGVDRSCLFALNAGNRNAALSARNIKHVQTIRAEQLNAFDILSKRFLVVEADAFKAFIDGSIFETNKVEEAA